jgi:ABC-2 type transport system permease protein
VLCTGFGAGTTAAAVATDMTNGIVERSRSVPVHGSSVLVGHVVASMAGNLAATTLVVGIGWRPSTGPLGWATAAAMTVLFVAALSWLAAGVGLLARSVEAANSMTFVLMFVPYVSTAFVPARTMPGPLRAFAEHQPLTPVVETMRGIWAGHTSTGASVGHDAWLPWCTAWLSSSPLWPGRLGCSATGRHAEEPKGANSGAPRQCRWLRTGINAYSACQPFSSTPPGISAALS